MPLILYFFFAKINVLLVLLASLTAIELDICLVNMRGWSELFFFFLSYSGQIIKSSHVEEFQCDIFL